MTERFGNGEVPDNGPDSPDNQSPPKDFSQPDDSGIETTSTRPPTKPGDHPIGGGTEVSVDLPTRPPTTPSDNPIGGGTEVVVEHPTRPSTIDPPVPKTIDATDAGSDPSSGIDEPHAGNEGVVFDATTESDDPSGGADVSTPDVEPQNVDLGNDAVTEGGTLHDIDPIDDSDSEEEVVDAGDQDIGIMGDSDTPDLVDPAAIDSQEEDLERGQGTDSGTLGEDTIDEDVEVVGDQEPSDPFQAIEDFEEPAESIQEDTDGVSTPGVEPQRDDMSEFEEDVGDVPDPFLLNPAFLDPKYDPGKVDEDPEYPVFILDDDPDPDTPPGEVDMGPFEADIASGVGDGSSQDALAALDDPDIFKSTATDFVLTDKAHEAVDRAVTMLEDIPPDERYDYIKKIQSACLDGGVAIPYESLAEKIDVTNDQLVQDGKLGEADAAILSEIQKDSLLYTLDPDAAVNGMELTVDRIATTTFSADASQNIMVRNALWVDLAIHFAELGKYDYALAVTEYIKEGEINTGDKVLDRKLAAERDHDRLVALDRIIQKQLLAESNKPGVPSSVNTAYADIYLQGEHLDVGEKAMPSTGSQALKDRVLSNTAYGFVKSGSFTNATDCADRVSDPAKQMNLYCGIASGLAATGDHEQLAALEAKIYKKVEGLPENMKSNVKASLDSQITVGYVRSGNYISAVDRLHGINNPKARAQAINAFFEHTGKKGIPSDIYDSVYASIDSFPPNMRAAVLAGVAKTLGGHASGVDSEKQRLDQALDACAGAIKGDEGIREQDKKEALLLLARAQMDLHNSKEVPPLYSDGHSDNGEETLNTRALQVRYDILSKSGDAEGAIQTLDKIPVEEWMQRGVVKVTKDSEVFAHMIERVHGSTMDTEKKRELLLAMADKQSLLKKHDPTIDTSAVFSALEQIETGLSDGKAKLAGTIQVIPRYSDCGLKPSEINVMTPEDIEALRKSGVPGVEKAIRRFFKGKQ